MPAFRSPSRVPSLPSAGLAGVALLVLATGVGCEPSPPLPSPATDPAPGVEAPPYRREPCLTGLEDGAEPPRWASSPASSSLVLVPGGDQLVVVDEDAEQLIVGTRAGGIWHRVFLAGRPHHVVIEPTSGLAVVSLPPLGGVELVDIEEPRTLGLVPVGVDPRGLAALGSGRVAVALAGQAEVAIVDVGRRGLVARHPVAPEPVAVALDRAGRLVTSHLVGSRVSLVDVEGGPFVERGLRTAFVNPNREREHWGSYQPHVQGARSLTPTPAGVVAVHSLSNPDPVLPAESCPYYGCTSLDAPAAVEPGFTQIDDDDVAFTSLAPVTLDPVATVVLGQAGGGQAFFTVGLGESVARLVCMDAMAPTGVHEEVVVGEGVTGIAADETGRTLFTWSSYDDTLTRITLDEEALVEDHQSFAWNLPSGLSEVEALGRRLFHRASSQVSANGSLSCASCHPGGRADGLTWQFPFGPRNTPQLGGGISDTAPFHWGGDVETFADLNGVTVQTMMGGSGLAAEDLDAIAAYLDTLPSARGPTPATDLAIERGRTLFHGDELGCSACHQGDDYTTSVNVDLDGAPNGTASTVGFQVPVLHGLARSAPYWHDGSCSTLGELLLVWVRTDRMGRGSHLTDEELSDLEAFLRSL